ncbi:MAG: hypothetical protein EXS68_02925 [Candidatus Ryanbacteria bacterium]|nr:hypothetical protein [Candidatus Ryanbacteria bacterium]
MHIVSVSPLVPLPRKYAGALSYFAKDAAPAGTLVSVPFQKRIIPALVLSSEPLAEKKLAIRKGAFALKRVHKTFASNNTLHPSLVSIARDLANYYQEPVGQIVKLFFPTPFLITPPATRELEIPPQVLQHPYPTIILGSFPERIEYYSTTIREAYAKKQSIVIFAPTLAVLEYIAASLAHLPLNPTVLHGSLTPKQMRLACERIITKKSPSLVIASPLALGLLSGIEHIIIVEDADSPHYIRKERPRISTARALSLFAQHIRARCIEGKTLPSVRDLKDERPLHYLSSRIKPHAPGSIIDMRQQKNPIISNELLTLLTTQTERTLLFTTRKGFYTFIICSDCSTLLTCPGCQVPLVMHDSGKRIYHCHRCDRQLPPEIPCSNCKGWNLRGYGIGTQRVAEELKTLGVQRPLWIYDDSVAPNKTSREKIIAQFLASSDGILIGTDALLEEPRLVAKHGAVANLDNLFSIPDFRINERVLAILLKFSSKISESFIWVQTRFPQHQLFGHFVRQDIKGFLQTECADRIRASLPPAVLFIKATLHDIQKDRRTAKIKELESLISEHAEYVSSYSAFNDTSRHHLLISINEKNWVDNAEDLKGILATHADGWDIVVDPENIL